MCLCVCVHILFHQQKRYTAPHGDLCHQKEEWRWGGYLCSTGQSEKRKRERKGGKLRGIEQKKRNSRTEKFKLGVS